jgi:ribose transport system permease protein
VTKAAVFHVLGAAWSWLFLIGLLIFFEVWSQASYGISFVWNSHNVRSITLFAAIPLTLALGQTFVIISAGIDLSVGFTMGLASAVLAVTMQIAGVGGSTPGLVLLVGLLAAIGASVVPGAVNGVLIAHMRVPPFIGTLGMYGIARGAAFLIAETPTVPINNPWLFEIGNGKLWLIPIPVVITAVLVIALHYVLTQTSFGQHTYAIGGNRQAAIRAGINVRGHTISIYVLAAVCAGIAGILYAARFSAGAPQGGEPMLLDSIAAVVIGGASLFGGSGKITGTVIGAFIIAVIQYGLVFVNVEPFWQFVAVGGVIIIAVLIDQSKAKLAAGEPSDE